MRVSGPAAGIALASLTGRPPPRPRLAALRRLFDAADGAALDEALVLYFSAPQSFTGEDVVELHLHGGPAVVAGVMAALARLPGMRLAEPGEFTRRAFENGKLDLAQAEGLADLIEAETEGQRRQALRQMEGALSALYEGWRAELLAIAALLEAEIDFPDEDLPGGLAARTAPRITALANAMAAHLADRGRGERVRDGFRIALIGAPNCGKSSLLNALARREAAIVSDIPGTTRDVVEIRVTLAGYPVWIADTAGLREAADAIEAEGVKRALARAQDADLRLGVVDAREPAAPALLAALRPQDLVILNKSDLAIGAAPAPFETARVSALTGDGLEALEARLAAIVAARLDQAEAPALTRARHRALAAQAEAALRRALDGVNHGAELAAEDVRLAASALGRITGRIDVEDILGEIFSSFCIGK